MGSDFSFRLFYLQYPPAICGFGMHAGISHVCKVFIRQFLPEIWVKIFPSVFRMSGQIFPVGFQDVTSWKKICLLGGHYTYIYIGIFLYIHTSIRKSSTPKIPYQCSHMFPMVQYSFPHGHFGSDHCGVFFKPGCQCPWWTPSEPPGWCSVKLHAPMVPPSLRVAYIAIP